MDHSMHFTLHLLADWLIPTPTQLLWEAFSHAVQLLHEDYSLTYFNHRLKPGTHLYSWVNCNADVKRDVELNVQQKDMSAG